MLLFLTFIDMRKNIFFSDSNHSHKMFYGLCLVSTFLLLSMNSCQDNKQDSHLAINEIMASNHTGLLDDDGELYDWIEIKNLSDSETANLSGYTLTFEKDQEAVQKKKEKKDSLNNEEDNNNDNAPSNDVDNDKAPKMKSWDIPDVTLKPGECLVIFASKKDKDDPKGKLHASFKLSDLGGTLKLMHGDKVISEIKYGELNDDQCYRRLGDKKYEVSYEATPGFDNNAQGFESYCTLLEKQRKSPLRLWEIHTKGYNEGKAWIEVKNVSHESINLQDYCLTDSKKELSQWHFPQVELKPGEFYVVDCSEVGFKVGGKKSVTITKDEKFMDGMCGAAAPLGISTGRVEGKDGIFYFTEPTRGAENTTNPIRSVASLPK